MTSNTIIASRTNPRVKQLRAALAGNARLSDGLVGIEGEHLIAEALRSGIALKTIFLNENRALPPGMEGHAEVIRLTQDVFGSAVATESPQGIAALLAPPKLEMKLDTAPLLAIGVALQDPGNLGTLTRSAEAFGAAGVITTPGTVSAWNQKTLRASAGSVFRMPVETYAPAQIVALRRRGIRLLAAVVGGGKPPAKFDLCAGIALMIGNEGSGLSSDWVDMADARITLQYPGRVESLNAGVAGSLLLYEAARQRASKL